MIYTGIDGNKSFSIDYSILKKKWQPSSGKGRKIYVIPSDRCLVIKKETDIGDLTLLKKTLSIEIQEKFPGALWDVRLEKGFYCLSAYRDFDRSPDAYSLDPEVFSLQRCAVANDFMDGWVIDLGRKKTTFVLLKDGNMESYRVVLKGGEHLDREIALREGLKEDEVKNQRELRGLEWEKVKEGLMRILGMVGANLSDEKVFLTGGLSRLKGIENLFGKVYRNRYGGAQTASAFGASLKYVIKDCSPDFRGGEVPAKDLRRVAVILGASAFTFLLTLYGFNRFEKTMVGSIRSTEKQVFQERFKDLPPVVVRDQLASISKEARFPMTLKLLEFSGSLKKGIKIFRIEYSDGSLKITGEANSKDIIEGLKPKKLKETPEGNYEFEVELK